MNGPSADNKHTPVNNAKTNINSTNCHLPSAAIYCTVTTSSHNCKCQSLFLVHTYLMPCLQLKVCTCVIQATYHGIKCCTRVHC